MERLLQNYTSVITTLEDTKKDNFSPDIDVIIKYFRQIETIITIGLYTDLLEPIYRLSKAM